MKLLYRIYSICIATPIFVVATIITAVTVIIFAFLGDSKVVGYWMPHWWSRLTCAVYLLPVHVEGRENLDKNQSYVFLANHQGYFDIFLVYGYMGHNFKWMMKEYLRKIPFVGYACAKSKHVYVGDSISSIQHTVAEARETLRGGMSLVIFPEGTRTFDGNLQEFKRGAFMLANEIGLPIVPMSINGSFDIYNRKDKFVHQGKLSLTIHKPITAEDRKGKPTKVFMKEVHEIINSGIKPSKRK
jgi:1-acyl-sn-glycerol-3-phosphate acyltransferase